MSEPVTLPGEIPGLLIPGVLVSYVGMSWRLIVVDMDGYVTIAADGSSDSDCMTRDLKLDLSDRVSRVAVAWWVIERGGGIDDAENTLLIAVKQGGHVNCKGQEQLRDMVLRRYNRSCHEADTTRASSLLSKR